MLNYLTLYLFPAMLLLGAGYDVASFRIPNWIPAGLAAAFLPVAIMSGMSWGAIGLSVLAGIILLIAGMALFAFKVLGGGDAKLLAAAALWIGMSDLLLYVCAVGIVGGLFAILLLTFRRVPMPATLAGQSWLMRLHSGKEGIPYGVALAAAGVLVFPQTVLYTSLTS